MSRWCQKCFRCEWKLSF